MTLNLITDRTQADVKRWRTLGRKGFKNMTEAEKAEWLAGMKGAYNATDLNRVESSVAYLVDILRALPEELKQYAIEKGVSWDAFFNVPYDAGAYNPETKTSWRLEEIPSPEDMDRYLGNVVLLRSALEYVTDDLPESMEKLTYEGANSIEKALEGLDAAIAALRALTQSRLDKTAAAWFYSGEIYAMGVL